MKNILSFLIFFTVLSNVSAQTNFNRFDYWFGNPNYVLHCYQSISNLGSFFYCPMTIVDSTHTQYIQIAKLDNNGALISNSEYRDTNFTIGFYEGHSIIVDSDSNIIVCAFKSSNITNYWDGLLIKLNKDLDTIWTRTYQMLNSIAGCTSGQDPVNFFTSIKEDPKGGYIVAGNYLVNCVSGSIGLYLTKYDTAGNLMWVRTYPGIRGTYNFEFTSDGGILIPSAVGNQAKLFKIDTLGNTMWNMSFNSKTNIHVPFEIEYIDTNHVIMLCAYRYNTALDLNKISLSKINLTTKTKDWEKDYQIFYNFRDPDLNQYAKLKILPNKDILIAGTSQVFAWDSLTGGYKGILFKLNQNGDSLWTRYYHTTQSFNDDDVFCDVELMEDGGFLAVGYHNPWNEGLNWAAWMVRTDSLGNAPMDGSVSIESAALSEVEVLRAFPNPANLLITINAYQNQNLPEGLLQIFNTQGIMVKEVEIPKNQISFSLKINDLAQGMYLGIVNNNKGENWSFKFVKE